MWIAITGSRVEVAFAAGIMIGARPSWNTAHSSQSVFEEEYHLNHPLSARREAKGRKASLPRPHDVWGLRYRSKNIFARL